MSIAMDVRSCLKATLLALTTLSVLSWLPNVYSCLRAFFMESLPSLASAVVAPKCLFVFSNIIVVFLISESKLSRKKNKKKREPLNTAIDGGAAAARDGGMLHHDRQENDLVVVVREALLLPTSAEERELEEEEEEEHNKVMVVDEEVQVASELSEVDQDVLVDQCEDEEVNHFHLVLHDADEVNKGGELEMVLREEEASGAGDLEQDGAAAEELEDRYLPPADELNRRVEDFIARFNMERQLEARMLVCCC